MALIVTAFFLACSSASVGRERACLRGHENFVRYNLLFPTAAFFGSKNKFATKKEKRERQIYIRVFSSCDARNDRKPAEIFSFRRVVRQTFDDGSNIAYYVTFDFLKTFLRSIA